MTKKKQAEIIATIIASIASNLTATEESTPPKKVKYPLDQKEPKSYPKPKGRDQRWR